MDKGKERIRALSGLIMVALEELKVLIAQDEAAMRTKTKGLHSHKGLRSKGGQHARSRRRLRP